MSNVDLAITTIRPANFSISAVPRAIHRAGLGRQRGKSFIGLRASIIKGCVRELLPSRAPGRGALAGRVLLHYNFWKRFAVGFGAVPRTLRSLGRKGVVLMASSPSHRGRKSFVYTTRFTAARGIGFVTARNGNLVYVPVSRTFIRGLRFPRVIRRGASGRRATFAISVSRISASANVSTTRHSVATVTYISSRTGTRSFHEPNRVFPLLTGGGNILRHGNRARTAISLYHLTKLGRYNLYYRVVQRSNAVVHATRLTGLTRHFRVGFVAVHSLRRCHGYRSGLISRIATIGLPAGCNAFETCNFIDHLGKRRRVTLMGNSVNSKGSVLYHIRSRYLAKSAFNSLHYSYNRRLTTTVARVRGRSQNVLLCVQRRNQNVNLVGGLHTCRLRRRNVSALRTGLTLKFRKSRQRCCLNTRVLQRLNMGDLHLLAGGPSGMCRLSRFKLRVSRHMPVRVATAPCSLFCLGAGRTQVKRLLRCWRQGECLGVGAFRNGLISRGVGINVMTTQFGRFVASGLLDKTVSNLLQRSIRSTSVRIT